MTEGVDEWSRDPTEDDEDDDDEIVYDDDEDEFGLPSLASMRRKKVTSPSKTRNIDLGGVLGGNPTSLGYGLAASNRQRANSSDIAEERGTPMYPTTRKGEGKILRPQYKDILQGRNALRGQLLTYGANIASRSCECFEFDQSYRTAYKRLA